VKLSGLTEAQIDTLWREAGRQRMSLLADLCERWMDCDGTDRTTIDGTIRACIRGSKLATLVGL
jgi:hypothetical protein